MADVDDVDPADDDAGRADETARPGAAEDEEGHA
jgi:hypothetical protein